MLWRYSRSDTKVLLVATLLVFSGYGLLLSHEWQSAAPSVGFQAANTVGVQLGVPENEINTRVAQLDEREAAIVAREQAIAQTSPGRGADATTLFWVTIAGIGLLGLILLNFYLDSRRRYSLAG